MYIWEIIEIQQKCRKQAKEMTREAYGKIDAIWTDRIGITPELEAMGENIVARINAKMPNLLMRKEGFCDIEEMAIRYGFENGRALVERLLAYEPRKKFEEKIYKDLLAEKMASCAPEEIAAANRFSVSEIKKIYSECKAFAREMTQQAYEKYDEIWAGKIRITPELLKQGRDFVADLNRKMPNLLTHDPMRSALDQVAMEYHFEDSNDLAEFLMSYQPRSTYQSNLCEELARNALGLSVDDAESDCSANWLETGISAPYEIDEVPF